MEYYAVPTENHVIGHSSYSCLTTSYPYPLPSHTFQERVLEYDTPLPYYSQAGQRNIVYPYHPQAAHVYYPHPPGAGQDLYFEYPPEEAIVGPIHAPVPASSHIRLLPASGAPVQSTPHVSSIPDPSEFNPHLYHSALQETSPLEEYKILSAAFPAPCDPLNELLAGDSSPSGAVPPSTPTTHPQFKEPPVADNSRKPKNVHDSTKINHDHQRQAYFRQVAVNVGFTPTNPDSITSHEKKRHYLECLEQYVVWLHEQLRLHGQEPVPPERVDNYRTPDIRTSRDKTRSLNESIVREERRFVELQDQVFSMAESSLN